jgi:hypothetical protein
MIGTDMRPNRTCLVALVAAVVALACSGLSAAQYGHPLKGTWSGDWGPNKETRHRLLLELHWDGQAVTGTINPGPNAVPLRTATLDPSTWSVRLEAEGAGPNGTKVRYLVEGKLENLGSYYRTLSGTWTQGTERGDFRVTRN